MLVERAIRPFTVHRKNSLFFSSEEGVETALTFFTLIEACKNVGLNARDYIASTIRLLMDGNKNYDAFVPMPMARLINVNRKILNYSNVHLLDL